MKKLKALAWSAPDASEWAGADRMKRSDHILKKLKAVAWSLKTRMITSGCLSFIHCLENS